MRNDEGSDPLSKLCSASAPLFRFSFFFYVSLWILGCWDLFSLQPYMAIHRKQSRNAEKFAQASWSSPRKIVA